MVEAAPGNAELLLQQRPVLHGVEQAQRRLVHGRALEGVERHLLHQVFEALGDGALATAHGTQQIEDLLALFQALGRMAEEAHHLFDGVFHAVELGEGRIAPDDLVGKQPRLAWIIARVHHFRFADGCQHALGSTFVSHGIALAQGEKFVQRHLFFAKANVTCSRVADDIHTTSPGGTRGRTVPRSCKAFATVWNCCSTLHRL